MRKIVFKVSEVVLRDVEVIEDLDDPGVTYLAPQPWQPPSPETTPEPTGPSERETELAAMVDVVRREYENVLGEKEVLSHTCDHLREKLAEAERKAFDAEAKVADMPSLRQGHIDKERTITGLRQTLEREQLQLSSERLEHQKQVERLRRQIQTAREEGEATAAELRGRLEVACAPGLTLTPDELALIIKEIDIGVAHGRIKRDAVGQAVIEKLYAARGDT